MLSGASVDGGDSVAELAGKHLGEPPPSLLERAPALAIPAGLDAVVQKLMERPQDRFQLRARC